MLVRFSVENWMSFRERTEFTMIGTREKQHNERIPSYKKYNAKFLPVSAIYGGNASGKSNFCKALQFVRFMVIKGLSLSSRIPVIPYALDRSFSSKESKFSVEMLINDIIYELSFSLTEDSIQEEKLVRISSSNETILYHRLENNSNPNFHSSLNNKYNKDNFLSFVFKATRKNQLFLTNTINQNCEVFREVFSWFEDNLRILSPDSEFLNYHRLIDKSDPLYSEMADVLNLLDTGIIRLGDEDIPIENIPVPNQIKEDLEERVKEKTVFFLASSEVKYIIKRDRDKLIAKKVITYHKNSSGGEVRFELRQESDGTKRLLDILPAFIELFKKNSKKVLIIDELDRSLHSLLSRQLVEAYLSRCSTDSRSQFIFTTHDVLLMDQKLIRRDEMWVTERDQEGNSTMYSFSDFENIRYDKNIRNSYLSGRMGGIPKVLLSSSCFK